MTTNSSRFKHFVFSQDRRSGSYWPSADQSGDAVAASFGVWTNVIDDQRVQSIGVISGVGHRDDDTHGRANQRKTRQFKPVDKGGEIACLIRVLVHQ